MLFGLAGIACAQSQLAITTTNIKNATFGVPYNVQLQATGGLPPYNWFICASDCPSNPGDPSSLGVTLNPMGLLSGTPNAIGSVTFVAVVSDSDDSAPVQVTLTLNVLPCTPTVTPASGALPPTDVNTKYLGVLFTATGCPGPYTYSVVTNTYGPNPLPAGLFITGNTLGGTPTQTGTFNFSVTANGANQASATNDYSIVVNPLPTLTTASTLPSGPVGALYSQQFAATGGVPGASGYVFSMNNNPPGISMSPSGLLSGTPTQAGTFSFNVGVRDSLGGQTSSPFQVSFVSGTPQLQIAPQALTFYADQNGNPPPSQSISLTPSAGATPPQTFSVKIDSGQDNTPAPAWISVSPAGGTAPAGLEVSVNQGTMAAGAYPARIHILDSNNQPTDITVTLNVKSNPQTLTVSPAQLRFTARTATPGTLTENLVVSNTGPGTLSFNAAATGGSSWISAISPVSGQTTLNSPTLLQVQVNTAGLAAGNYHDSIHVATPAGNADIPISLFVQSSGPALSVSPTAVLFQARQNGGTSVAKAIQIEDIGDPSSTVNWSAAIVTNQSNWLSLGSASGAATTNAPGSLTLIPVQNATQLAPGPYYALIKITDSNSHNSPQYVSAVLNIQPDSVAPSPDLSPAGLFFTTPAGGSAPAAKPVILNASSADAVIFTASATTSDLGKWLSATPATGNVSGQSPATVLVSVDPTGLAAGIYSGNVNVSIGQSLESVNVTFVVQPNGSSGSAARARPQVAGCTASKLAMTETGLVDNFAVPAGWPATLVVQLNDDCGAAVTAGSVTASFSNTDAPLALIGDSLGNYSATWQPGSVNSDMVVTLNGASGSLQPAVAKLYGGIAQNLTPPPTLAAGGTLNNLNPVVGGPLAPGMIAEVFGNGLASSATQTGKLPLPTTFNNTYAQIGPYQAPLYFLSNGQVNIQIPSEITGPQQLPIILSVNNALTVPITLDVVPNAPGVLSRFDGPMAPSVQNNAHMIAQHATDFSLVSSSSPAKPGEYLVMYLVGLGATNPSLQSGFETPTSPFYNVVNQPTVTVDSQQSNVYFAGLTPGFAGLYQIVFQVPTGVHSGDVVVTVTQNGIAANPTLLPAVSQ